MTTNTEFQNEITHLMSALEIDMSQKYNFGGKLYDSIVYQLSSGGKRIRPLLVFIAAGMVKKAPKSVYSAAIAAELTHNSSLIHDDIMDNSVLRRGKDTLHIHSGTNMAILAGDSLLSLAYLELISNCTKDNIERVLKVYSQAGKLLCEGQEQDLVFETKDAISFSEYLNMITKKTAVPIQASLEISAILSNATEDQINAFQRIGTNLGIAFQIQDDYLDTYGNAQTFGKTIGKDLIEGKRNYVILVAEQMNIQGISSVASDIKNKKVTAENIQTYIDLLEVGELKNKIQTDIQIYINKAISDLEIFEETEAKEYMLNLISYLVKRSV